MVANLFLNDRNIIRYVVLYNSILVFTSSMYLFFTCHVVCIHVSPPPLCSLGHEVVCGAMNERESLSIRVHDVRTGFTSVGLWC